MQERKARFGKGKETPDEKVTSTTSFLCEGAQVFEYYKVCMVYYFNVMFQL